MFETLFGEDYSQFASGRVVGETRPSAVIYVPSPIISGGQWLAENRPEREVIDVTTDAQSEAPRELTQLERMEQDPEFSKLAPDAFGPLKVIST